MPSITWRFYEELNDFLPVDRRRRDFVVELDRRASVKDLVESLGVPHVEVDLILVDGESVGFDHVIDADARVSVYPVFESLDVGGVQRLRPKPLREPRFVLDGHLGWLARRLRILGFDCRYEPRAEDAALARFSAEEDRILLSRDRELLKRRAVTRGYCVRSTDPPEQIREVIDRLDLRASIRPFGRCPGCNARLAGVDREDVADVVPPESWRTFDRFWRCTGCGHVYWRGSHVDELERWIADLGPA